MALIGVNNEEYTVETVTWDGEAYEDSERDFVSECSGFR